MQRYDEDYKNFVAQLNSAFTQNQKDNSVDMGVFDKVELQKQKLIEKQEKCFSNP